MAPARIARCGYGPAVTRGPAEETGLHQPKPYAPIIAFCERCLVQYSDSYRGVGWTMSQEATDRRHQVILDLVEPSPEGR